VKKIKGKLSYASVMATIAVFLVLGGGAALAATGSFTGKQKKQVGKIATKVFNARIGGASVNHAGSADTAAKATTATKATEANKAITATKATEATKAVTATKAADAEKLGGRTPAEYQRKLKEGCAPPTSIAGLSNEGDVTCTTPVTALIATPAAGENQARDVGNGLQILTVCHDGGTVQISFQNVGGAQTANLNWLYSTGSAVNASGVTVTGGSEQAFLFLGARIEGQFIWSIGNVVKTVNLHAFDGGTFCETRGTVETANG
jgi:hypothetical protein